MGDSTFWCCGSIQQIKQCRRRLFNLHGQHLSTVNHPVELNSNLCINQLAKPNIPLFFIVVTMKLNIIVPRPIPFNSLNYCGQMMLKYYQAKTSYFYRFGYYNIMVDDLQIALKNRKLTNTLWADTPLLMEKLPPARASAIYTCSEWNKKQLEGLGYKCEGYMARLINPLAFTTNSPEKRVDFIGIGHYGIEDRKNFHILSELKTELGLNIETLTDARLPTRTYNFGAVSDEDKFKWISGARFLIQACFSGGFEMPTYEAMACGVPVIYSDIPPINEYAIGIPIQAGEMTIMPFKPAPIYHWNITKEAVTGAIKQAQGLTPEQYQNISITAKTKAIAMRDDALQKLNRIFGL